MAHSKKKNVWNYLLMRSFRVPSWPLSMLLDIKPLREAIKGFGEGRNKYTDDTQFCASFPFDMGCCPKWL